MHHNPPEQPLRVVIAPDSFKGTVNATQAAADIAEGWRRVRPHDDLACIPMADGGEGTLDAVAAARPEAELIDSGRPVMGPLGQRVPSRWLRIHEIALVELAAVAGLGFVDSPTPKTARSAVTDGLGAVIGQAADSGVSAIAVALGGSASTDGGLGALRALGVTARDRFGAALRGGGEVLSRIRSLETEGLVNLPPITVLTDVRAPLAGPAGAAYQYGPQKGADVATVRALDEGLRHWARLWELQHHVSPTLAEVAGAGAAGGVAYGLAAGLGAQITSGAQWLMDRMQVRPRLQDADVLITGEGRFDIQSLTGKLVSHLLDLPGPRQRWVVAGVIDSTISVAARTIALVDLADTPEAALAEPSRWLLRAGEQMARSTPG